MSRHVAELSAAGFSNPRVVSGDDTNPTASMLVFFSKSRDVEPGKGAGERGSDPAWIELAKIAKWRQVLSNFHVAEFVYRDKTYRSIEHAFQASKIALVDPEAAVKFTVESGDPIGQGDGVVAQRKRKLVRLDAEALKKWDEMKNDVMEEIARAKYAQCEPARKVLALTGKAQLWHHQRMIGKVRFEHLERIRDS